MFKVMLAISLSFLFISCSSLSERQCANMNWYKRGMDDAKAGLPKSSFGKHKDACLRHGIEFDREEYINGFEEGLKK